MSNFMLNAIQRTFKAYKPSAEVRDQVCNWTVASSQTDWENVVRENKLRMLPAPSTSCVPHPP